MKAKGFHEFLDPDTSNRRIFDHEYIRHSIRNRTEIQFSIAERPRPKSMDVTKFREAKDHYQSLGDSKFKVLSIHEYQHLEHQWEEMDLNQRVDLPFMPRSAVTTSFKVMVCSAAELFLAPLIMTTLCVCLPDSWSGQRKFCLFTTA